MKKKVVLYTTLAFCLSVLFAISLLPVRAAVLNFVVNRLEFIVNPKRRKKTDILKGIEIHN